MKRRPHDKKKPYDCWGYQPTNQQNQTKSNQTTEQSPSESNSHSASQEIPRLFMEPKGSLPCSQQPASGLYPEPDEFSP
jgi:hypothetical protein